MVSIPENFYVYLIQPLGSESAGKSSQSDQASTSTKKVLEQSTKEKSPPSAKDPELRSIAENPQNQNMAPIPVKGSFSIPRFLAATAANQELLRQMSHFAQLPSTSNGYPPTSLPAASFSRPLHLPMSPFSLPNGHLPIGSSGLSNGFISPTTSTAFPYSLPQMIKNQNIDKSLSTQPSTASNGSPKDSPRSSMIDEEKRKRLKAKILETPVRKEIEAKKAFLLLVDKADGPNGVNKKLEKLFPFGSGMAIVKLLDVVRPAEFDPLESSRKDQQPKVPESTRNLQRRKRHPCESPRGFSLAQRSRMSEAFDEFCKNSFSKKILQNPSINSVDSTKNGVF